MTIRDAILPGLPVELIEAAYAAAPGNEIASGKFANPASSAALAANTFGLFLDRPDDCPLEPLTGTTNQTAKAVNLEGVVRFPWRGGLHPCLDALIETDEALIGVESKRYEPFRPKPIGKSWSDAYWRPVWGERMTGYEAVRDALRDGALAYRHLDAMQLVKHAFGLRTASNRAADGARRMPVLVYLHAEPKAWPDGSPVAAEDVQRHREEIADFAARVAGSEIVFRPLRYREMLAAWHASVNPIVHTHAETLQQWFDV